MSTHGIEELTTLVTRLGGVLLLLLVARIVIALTLATVGRMLAANGRRASALRVQRAAARVAPALVRGTLVAAIGGAALATPALAAPARSVERHATTHAVEQLDVPVLDRVPQPAPRSVATEAADPSAAPASTHVVRPGESLWSIAAATADDDSAGTDGTAAATAAREWPRWYAANRDVIGPDPSLLRPGQHLTAPEARR